MFKVLQERIYSLYKEKRALLILAGEPYINNILEKPVHEALKQRITVHYNFEGFIDNEVSDYIYHKIQLADGSKTIIELISVSTVHSYAQGNPRPIGNIIIEALTFGAQFDKKSIDSEVMLAAVNNQSLY